MRMSFASLAALAVIAVAAPAFGQTENTDPAPTAKPKPGTAAYCNTLKSTSSKTACLKKVHAQATPAKAPPKTAKATTKTKKPTTAPAAAESKTSMIAPATQSAAAPTPPQTIQVPPLPQKTI